MNNFFSNYVFNQKNVYDENMHQRCIFLLYDFPRILRFSFSSLFNVFLLFVFFFSSMFSALHPITKKTMILSKYHSNMTLIRDYQRALSIGKKTLILACTSQLYTLKLLDHVLSILEFFTLCATLLKPPCYVNL